MPDGVDESIDMSAGHFCRQAEAPRLRQEVVDAGRATVVADGQRQVAPLQAGRIYATRMR